jgi:hypothetical protein
MRYEGSEFSPHPEKPDCIAAGRRSPSSYISSASSNIPYEDLDWNIYKIGRVNHTMLLFEDNQHASFFPTLQPPLSISV